VDGEHAEERDSGGCDCLGHFVFSHYCEAPGGALGGRSGRTGMLTETVNYINKSYPSKRRPPVARGLRP
ncbi:MAG TPA: hypothetical protein VMP03_08380, partial [Methylomirabilota bacterium]|nr:hypothetical protein [Methylomirabilota bacterium]